MKLIDVDSKATLEVFLTLKKILNLYSFYGNVMKKSVVSRISLHSDKDVETYLLKMRSDDNEKNELLYIDSSLESLTLIKKIIYTFPFFKLL
jgi:hypothetical protein